jgi:hypothetical protein
MRIHTYILLTLCLGITGCESKATTAQHNLEPSSLVLFDVPLQEATWDTLTTAILTAGAKVKSLKVQDGPDQYCDFYDPKIIFKQASSLKVCYTQLDRFIEASYQFPSDQASSLLALMTSKYGKPSRTEMEQYRPGQFFAIWINSDNLNLRIERSSGNSSTELTYVNVNVIRMLNQEMFERRRQKQQQKYAAHLPLVLFGVEIKGALRETLRAAILKAGAVPKKLNSNPSAGNYYPFDDYYPRQLLKGANLLTLGYTTHDRFAFADYTFASHLDVAQAQRIIDLVSSKYGKPDTISGNINLGPVSAEWNMGDMFIAVERSWPDTTTHLIYYDQKAFRELKEQFQAAKQQQQQAEYKAQSNSF